MSFGDDELVSSPPPSGLNSASTRPAPRTDGFQVQLAVVPEVALDIHPAILFPFKMKVIFPGTFGMVAVDVTC